MGGKNTTGTYLLRQHAALGQLAVHGLAVPGLDDAGELVEGGVRGGAHIQIFGYYCLLPGTSSY